MIEAYRKDSMPDFYRAAVYAHSNTFTKKEELRLLKSAQRGNMDARNKLLMANQKLIVKMALRIAGGYKIKELIQEGNIGVMVAIRRFNSKRYKCKLGTYAIWWIRQYMIRFFENTEEEIRVPVYAHHIRKCLKKKEKYGILLSKTDIKSSIAQSKTGRVAISLDTFDCDNEKIAGKDISIDIENNMALDSLMSLLTERERHVMVSHYAEEKTLREIAKDMGCSRQTVLNWETSAMKKIHNLLAERGTI